MRNNKPFLTFGRFFPRQVLALVSDRTMDCAQSNASPETIQKRTIVYKEHLGIGPEKIFDIKQVHGDTVIPVKRTNLHLGRGTQEADGSFTGEFGIPLAVRTADCLSIFIFDPAHNVIGLVHAGWRGTKEGIVKKAIDKMKEEWRSVPQELKVAFGPCIRPCCYQVGREFKDFFPRETMVKKNGLHLDLPLANKHQLLESGLTDSNIFDCAICTCCDDRFFSHRREGEKSGRMISVMMIKPS